MAEAIAHAEHLKRLRREQRAVRDRKGGWWGLGGARITIYLGMEGKLGSGLLLAIYGLENYG